MPRESFHVNLNFSGPVVPEKNSFNDLTLFLHFGDHLLFEEDLALYLNKLEIPFTKICAKFD
jgi:hypothetical protein